MTVTIDKLTLRDIHLPLREPFTISSGTVKTRRILLLELTSAEGATTWSECVAGELPNYSPETIDTSALAIRQWIAPRVLGRPFAHPGDVAPALAKDFRGHNMAKAAVEMGAWALAAVESGVSLAQIIGGTRDKIATGISLGIQSTPDHLIERVQAAIADGYRKVKIKIQPGSDLEFLTAAREAAGPDASLMADANNAYTVADFDLLARLDDLDLIMIEQPLAWDDVVQHARLQRRLRTPICLDESITGHDRAIDMKRTNHQHQARTRGRIRRVPSNPQRVRATRHSRVVRRHVGERNRTGIQRRAGITAEFPSAWRRQSKRTVLGAGCGDPGVDHERRRHGRRPRDGAGARRDGGRGPNRGPHRAQ
jgi:o-succinylbenzoate synthase